MYVGTFQYLRIVKSLRFNNTVTLCKIMFSTPRTKRMYDTLPLYKIHSQCRPYYELGTQNKVWRLIVIPVVHRRNDDVVIFRHTRYDGRINLD